VPAGELALEVHEPTGQDELFLLETALTPAAAVAGLADRVANLPDGRPLDWAAIPASQLAGVALIMRRAWVGDRLTGEGTCPRAGCRARFDISFSATEYMSAHRARVPRNVAPVADGWYRLDGSDLQFRIPSVHDLLAALAGADPAGTLVTRCVQPAEVTGRHMGKLDRAMAVMAPSLVDQVGGGCPECAEEVALTFDPLVYSLSELRDRFGAIYRDTHLLAAAYHWSEEEIHRLPRSRRRLYAALIDEMATM
jgi:hypothetical protein